MVSVHITHQNGEKCDLSDFDYGIVVDDRWAGLSCELINCGSPRTFMHNNL